MTIFQYIFHFNPYTKVWTAVRRDCYVDYLNGINHPEFVIHADSLSTLLSLFIDGPEENTSEKKEV